MTKSADRRKMGKLERRNTLIAYSFLAPNFIGFVVFTLIPVIFSIVLAFMNWSGGSKITWVGLDNFRLIFKDFSFTKSNLGIALKIPSITPLQPFRLPSPVRWGWLWCSTRRSRAQNSSAPCSSSRMSLRWLRFASAGTSC